MTALVLVAQTIIPRASIKNRMTRIEDVFLALNVRGFLTMVLLGLMAAGIAGYIALVAHSFNLGIQLRAAGAAAAEEERLVKNMDAGLREREANFAVRYQTALQDMDTVSSVLYLQAGSVAMR